jgi:isoleucyl-tRNA synthetase
VRLMAPILTFTAEEVWALQNPEGAEFSSVHLASFPEPIEAVRLTEEENRCWETLLALRQEVSRVLEKARAEKLIGSSLEAKVLVEGPDELAAIVSGMEDPEGFFIVSQFEIQPSATISIEDTDPALLPGVEVTVSRADGEKCPRCWTWKPDIGSDTDHPDVCPRCAGVLRDIDTLIEK